MTAEHDWLTEARGHLSAARPEESCADLTHRTLLGAECLRQWERQRPGVVQRVWHTNFADGLLLLARAGVSESRGLVERALERLQGLLP